MMARADEFGNIHSGLSSLNADGWEGRAADHFRSKFKVQVQGWVDAQEAFSSASEAYSSYASTLASAQSQCDGIRVRWEQGRDAVQQAQNNQADARSEAAAYGVLPVFGASCNEGPGRSAMAAAEADFQTLVDQVNEAGDLLITALNAGITKLPERTWWDAVTRTAGSILGGAFEAVVEIVKLVWKLSGGEGMWDFGRVLMGDMTLEEYDIKHREIPTETLAAMAKALWNDPVGFMTAVGKSLIDWDTWTDDPGRAIGHLLPDVILALATMGGSAGVSAGEKALTGGARALRIGKEVIKAILPINPDDVRSLAKLGMNMVGELSARGIDTAADLANTAKHLVGAADHAHDLGHAANGMAGALDGAADAGRATRAGAAIGDTSHAAHAVGGAADAAGSASHAASGGGGIASSASHAANGAGSASHGVSNAADAAGSASHAAHAGSNTADAAGNASHASHAGGNAADTAGNASHASHAGGNTADTAGNASHASHGGADVKDSGLAPTDPGHRSNGVSSAAQPAATPHASAAGDASTAGHTAPANTAPSASHSAHNNAFMNADAGGATHGAGSTANGATGAPATGAGTHGAPATGAPATGTHGAPTTGAPAAGSHGGASGHGAAGGSPAAPVRNDGVGERAAPSEAIAQKKPVDPDKIFTRSGTNFGAPANKIDTHVGGNQKSLDHVDVTPGDSDKVPNGQYHPVETAGGARRGGTDGAPSSAAVGPDAAAAAGGNPPRKPDDSYRVGPDRSMTPDEVGSQAPAAVGGKSPRKPDNSWDSDGLSTNRDDFDLFGSENRKDSSYLDYSLTHANGETRGADELVGAGVGRSEASVGAQGSYERAGAFGGSDPSRVSHGADGFGSTADFGANAGHAGHGAHGVSNSADVGGGVGDASRGTYAAGTPTGQGGGHVGADTGTHGGSSTPAQGPHRADPGMPTGDTHGVSRADSTPGHGDTPRAGQGGDGRPGAPSSHDAHSTPKKETPAGDSLGGDKQPHSGKNAADTPATHADEAADTRKAGHGSGDAHGSGKADADAKQGHDSVERADADPTTKDHSANGKANDAADSTRHGDKTEADKPGPDAPEKLPYNEIAEDLRGEPTRPAKTTPEDPQTVDDYAKVLDNNYEANRAATAAPDALEKSPNDDMIEELSGETQPHGGKYAADTPATHVDEAADTTKAGHGSGDANGSGKVDADAKQGHDSVERADADPTTKDHSANGKADDAADSTRHGDKTEADKPTSDKSHKEDDTAHHDDAEHPKDTDDKHTTKTDDADTKSTKDEADTHKSDKDSGERADADPKAKDHSTNGKADDAADSTRHGDKTEADKPEADKPTSDKSHKEDDAAHHDGDEHPKDTDDKHTTKTDDADTKSTKDEADTHKSDKDGDGKADDAADSTRHGDKTETDKPTSDKSHKEDDAAHPKNTDDKHTTKTDDADTKSNKDDADTHKSNKDSGEHADADPKAKDHSTNGKADDADSTRHGDKTEADKPTSDKTHKEDDATHHDGDEHPKDTDDKHTTKADDADSKSTKDGDGKSDKDGDGKSDKDGDGKSDKDDADDDSNKDDTDSKSDKDEKYEDLYDHSHDKDGPDSSYNPETDPHSNPDPDYDSLPDPSIDQSEGFPEGVDPYRTPPKTRRQLEEALEAWESYQKKALPDDAAKWHSGRYGFDDVVNPERALGYNPDGSPRSMEDFMNVYYDKEKKQPVWPWDVEGLRKNGAKLNANYHEYTSITPFIKTHGEDLCRLGDPGGKFAAAVHKDGTLPSFGERGLFQPFSLGAPDMRARLTGELPEGHIVKYGEVAPAFGQPGGAIQLQIWGPDEKTGIIRELTLKEWKKRGIIEYVKHD